MNAIVITKQERATLAGIGTARNSAKNPEWTRRKSDVFSDAEVDVLGMYGEYAVAEYLGLRVDTTITTTGDDGSDLKWNGLSIAVKYNHRWNGFLMVEHRKGDNPALGIMGDLICDIIVLTHGRCKPPTQCKCREEGGIVVVVAGWLTRSEFIEKMNSRDLGLGGRYICTCDQLRPMHQLWSPWRLLKEDGVRRH